LRLPPLFLSLALALSSSAEAVADELAGDGVDGKADGRPVGKLGACSCCANPPAIRKR
jgi:hypothetical protein